MTGKKIEEQIKLGAEIGHKTYDYANHLNFDKPAGIWFQESQEGLVLFVEFTTQACRWNQCRGCNLPSKGSKKYVPWRHVIKQIDYVFNDKEVFAKKDLITKMIISNNGSVLDEDTFPTTALGYLVYKINELLPNLVVLTMENRTQYVDMWELRFIWQMLKEENRDTTLEIAIGVEAHNEKIRNELFRKGLSLKEIRDLVIKLKQHDFRLKCYYMQKPVVGISDEEAVKDIQKGIDFLSRLAKKHGVKINMHLNPTYAAFGTDLEIAFREGKFTPPYVKDVARAALHGLGKNITIFIGLNDEGMAVPGGSFNREGEEEIVRLVDKFNKTQDYSYLEEISKQT